VVGEPVGAGRGAGRAAHRPRPRRARGAAAAAEQLTDRPERARSEVVVAVTGRHDILTAVAEYTFDTKYGPVLIATKSIDDGWVAFIDGDRPDVALAPDDGPVPLLEEEAIERLLQRIERS
jgi:hypothetical protein